eukprot:5215066-Alexandrium_andersonii.AAC.1
MLAQPCRDRQTRCPSCPSQEPDRHGAAPEKPRRGGRAAPGLCRRGGRPVPPPWQSRPGSGERPRARSR